MKRRLNILCLLVFLVFCYSVFNMGRDFGHGFSEGMKISHSGNQSVEQAINFRIATLMCAGEYTDENHKTCGQTVRKIG